MLTQVKTDSDSKIERKKSQYSQVSVWQRGNLHPADKRLFLSDIVDMGSSGFLLSSELQICVSVVLQKS